MYSVDVKVTNTSIICETCFQEKTIQFRTEMAPQEGSVFIDPGYGYAFKTLFTLGAKNWKSKHYPLYVNFFGIKNDELLEGNRIIKIE